MYNWPFYASAAFLALLVAAVLQAGFEPDWAARPLRAGLAQLIFWTVGSLAVSWYVYDYSPLVAWNWIPPLLADIIPARWAT